MQPASTRLVTEATAGITPGHGLPAARDLYRAQRIHPAAMRQSVITIFASGHGFAQDTAIGNAGSVADDTAIKILGAQSLRLTTAGAGTATAATRTITTTDMRRQNVKVTARIDTAFTNVSKFRLILGTDSSNYYGLDLFDTAGNNIFPNPSAWYSFEVNTAVAGLTGVTVGSPNLAAVTYIGLQAIDNGGGSIIARCNGLALVPATQDVYPNGVLTLSFDDGFNSQWNAAKPLLDTYGFPATAYVISDLIDNNAGYMTSTQLHTLEDICGWEIACHSHTAADHNATGGLTGISLAQAEDNFVNQKSWLLANGFVKAIDHTAYPKGSYNDALIALVKKYFTSARGLRARPALETFPPADLFRLRVTGIQPSDTLATHKGAIDTAVASGGWYNLYTHEVIANPASSVAGTSTSPAVLQAILDYVATTGIAVRTVSDVLRAGYTVLAANLTENARVTVSRSGTIAGVRRQINLIPGPGMTIAATDNPSTEAVDVTLNATSGGTAGIVLQKNGTAVGTEGILNLIPDTGIVITTTDDTSGGKLNVKIGSTAAVANTPAGTRSAVASGGSSTGTAAAIDHVHPRSLVQASDLGTTWRGWNFDPDSIASAAAPTTQVTIVSMIVLEQDTAISNLLAYINTAATTPTSGQCFAAIFSASGAQLAVSADISSQLTSTGVKTFAMTAATATLPAGTIVYGALLIAAATMPQLGRKPALSGLLTAPYTRRHGAISGTATAMQSSFVPSALVAPAICPWLAVS